MHGRRIVFSLQRASRPPPPPCSFFCSPFCVPMIPAISRTIPFPVSRRSCTLFQGRRDTIPTGRYHPHGVALDGSFVSCLLAIIRSSLLSCGPPPPFFSCHVSFRTVYLACFHLLVAWGFLLLYNAQRLSTSADGLWALLSALYCLLFAIVWEASDDISQHVVEWRCGGRP